jgi:enoyl-CoA hydratase
MDRASSSKETSRMLDYQTILYNTDDGIAHVTLNRPRYRNVQSTLLLRELDDAILQAGDDRNVRVIVLTGAGDHFSAGHDLGTPDEQAWREKYPFGEGIRGNYDRTWRLYIDMHLRWRNVQKPMIAAVQGYCIFGGWMVASTADIVFAAPDAMFLASLFQYFSVPWDIHPRKAKELLFRSQFVDGAEARELGLVNRVVPKERLMDETLTYARDVARNDPFDLRMIKLAVNNAQDVQGFTSYIQSTHSMYSLIRAAERDPGYAVKAPTGRRRPLVQVALDRYRKERGEPAG